MSMHFSEKASEKYARQRCVSFQDTLYIMPHSLVLTNGRNGTASSGLMKITVKNSITRAAENQRKLIGIKITHD